MRYFELINKIAQHNTTICYGINNLYYKVFI